ncbi:PREDICTED: uncharacterized protein LOC105571235, partial [Vollenhovia emeryi]|uniref:uncharacterized protein LOC105571235 n=1 Tax=Vollenhovia emeryi TaxID=411798 RepID=UPI0005F4B9C9
EELELSLRTEFETYLKGLTDDLRREVAEFQAKIESEVEKHKSQLDTAFREFSDRLGSEKEFDGAFSESVVEHLRLARAEGAQRAAKAVAESEDRRSASAAGSDDGSFAQLRNASADISAQSSQATILRSLVEHAAKFTTRGAFFIVKNDNFVGWHVFGSNAFAGDETVRSVEFPVGSRSLLAHAVRSLPSTPGGSAESAENTTFLGPLGFGDPVSMPAIPLIARGRGVAVLYADTTGDDAPINTEALETLVRVAGLTVELLASAQAVPASAVQETSEAESSYEPQPETAVEEPAAEYEEPTEYEEPSYAAQEEEESASESVYEVEAEPHYGDAQVVEEDHAASFESEEEITYEAEVEETEVVEEVSQTESGCVFAASEPAEMHAEAEEAEEPAEEVEVEPEPAEVQNEIPY